MKEFNISKALKMLETDPLNDILLFDIGLYYCNVKRFKESITFLEQGISVAKDNQIKGKLLYQLSTTYKDSGKAQAGKIYLEEALRFYPELIENMYLGTTNTY